MDDQISSSLLDALDPSDRSYVLGSGVRRRFTRNTYVLHAGDPARSVHLVLSGAFKLELCDPQAAQTILGVAVEDDLIGEIAALDGRPEPFGAVCVLPGETFAVDSLTFNKVLQRNPSAALEVTRTLAWRTRAYARTTFERCHASVGSRVASSILDLADSMGRMKDRTIEIEMPFAQGDLAHLAGTSRESVCKTMNHLRAKGVLTYRGRRVKILRPDLLERLRCGGPPNRG